MQARCVTVHPAFPFPPTEILPMRFLDWVGPLRAQGFSFYLDRLATQVHAMHAVHGRVALVGHSAGGWIARIALGSVPYQKHEYGLSPKVHTLLTLGTPHASIEQYPFYKPVVSGGLPVLWCGAGLMLWMGIMGTSGLHRDGSRGFAAMLALPVAGLNQWLMTLAA